MKLILASASPRRKTLLKALGVPFTILPSHIAEDSQESNPVKLVRDLALRKAQATAAMLRQKKSTNPRMVLGADTVVVLNGKILGKPRDAQDAYRMLYRLAGSTHRVVTGVALVPADAAGQTQVGHEVSVVRMKKMPIDDILRLSRKHLDKAGAYAIQDRSDPYAHVVKGSYENVVGLPLEVTRTLLQKAGFKPRR